MDLNVNTHTTMTNQQLNFAKALEAAVNEPGVVMQAYSNFHNYSIGNQILALLQCQLRGLSAGPIATFPKWKSLGRHVKRGERAISLCMPITFKQRDSQDAADAAGQLDSDEAFRTSFMFKPNWFVLSQTEGEEFELPSLPEWDTDTALRTLNFSRKEFTETNGNTQGYAQQNEFAINPVAQLPAKTQFHELAHLVIGHTHEPPNERTPKDLREVEAEAVALLCCEALNLPGAEFCRGYIQSYWPKGTPIPEANAKRILGAADKILKAGRPAASPTIH